MCRICRLITTAGSRTSKQRTIRNRYFQQFFRHPADEATRVLGLLATYHRQDLAQALERAVRYRAFSWSAVERILAAQARPRSVQEALTAEAQEQLAEVLRQAPLSVRPTAEYQVLLEENEIGHEEDDDSHDPTA